MDRIISASILSSDLCNLEKEIRRAEEAGCEYIHFDVMDGIFVNNISYGIPVLRSVSKIVSAVLDVHLMITDPLRYVKIFAESGADIITFHYESESDTQKTLDEIHSLGKKAGIAIKPATPVSALIPYLDKADMFLVMTVEPGFGGQGFIRSSLDKIAELKKLISEMGLDTPIQVDGGINDKTCAETAAAGASIFVAGSYIFNSSDMKNTVLLLRNNTLDR